MLEEVILSLLGFTGEIIVNSSDTFKVKAGCDKLTESEIVSSYNY